MADQVTNYQCPHCGGPLHYDGEVEKLVCDHCGSSFTTAEVEALYAEKDKKAAETKQKEDLKEDTSEKQADGLKIYQCPSCGAELICDENTSAMQCPFCGNSSIVPGQFTGSLKPDYVIPFRLKKEDAVHALKQHYKGKHLLPKSFISENHVQKIQGVYIPFWMFNGTASGSAVYQAEIVSRHREGEYEVTETKHFRVNRSGSIRFEKIPADASSKMPDDVMDSIEPYDYSELKPFSTAYLPGYLADKYDVSMETCGLRADKRAENTLYAELKNTVNGYDTVTRTSGNCTIQRGTAYYAMMPVWILNTRWNGRDFLFAMNGQTGKMVGDLPVSWGRFWGIFAGIAIPLMIVFCLIASALGY